MITLEKGIEQKGDIKVAAQIIQDLSSGIYSSTAVALKELINNSYDADAENVTIRMLPDIDTILITDNGSGMNAIDFDENFAWISKSNKRNNGDLSPIKKRPLIGKIGIGFIAVNEICNKMEIMSSKNGEKIKFTATINFTDIISGSGEKDEGKKTNSTSEKNGVIRATYTLINETEEVDKHYTIIRLIGIKDTAQTILHGKLYKSAVIGKSKKTPRSISDFKKSENMKELLEIHTERELHTFMEDDEYIQFVIELASYIPVEYIKNGPIEGVHNRIIKEIVNKQKELDFHVDLDGIYLKKPIYFAQSEDVNSNYYPFEDNLPVEGQPNLRFKGYFYCQDRLLTPKELNGISVKIKGVPIARRYGFDSTFLDYVNYTDQIFRNWVSGEIYIDEGLEDAMNIDRQSFRETYPSYIVLQNYIHKLLREEIFGKIAMSLYKEGKENRNKEDIREKNKLEKRVLKSKHIIKTITDEKPLGSHNEIPIIIEKEKDTSRISVDRNTIRKYHKRDWEVLEPIFIVFENALKESNGNVDKLRKLFYEGIDAYFKKQKRK